MSDVTDQEILALERPHPDLWKFYMLRSIYLLPLLPVYLIELLVAWFRYHTLRYRFDDRGVHCSWGILMRHEVNVAYSRMQDIHLTSGVLQRWLGLAVVQIQTASSNSGAELAIEGFKEAEQIRDFLYRRMHDARPVRSSAALPAAAVSAEPSELISALARVRDELRATRAALERLQPPSA